MCLDLNHISAHKEAAAARAGVDEIKAAAGRGDLFDTEKVMALWQQLRDSGDGEPQPYPDDTVRAIGRLILHNVIESKQP